MSKNRDSSSSQNSPLPSAAATDPAALLPSSLFTGFQARFGKAIAASRDAVGTLQTTLASTALAATTPTGNTDGANTNGGIRSITDAGNTTNTANTTNTTNTTNAAAYLSTALFTSSDPARSSMGQSLLLEDHHYNTDSFVPATFVCPAPTFIVHALPKSTPPHTDLDISSHIARLNLMHDPESSEELLFQAPSSIIDSAVPPLSFSARPQMDLLTGDNTHFPGNQSFPSLLYPAASPKQSNISAVHTANAGFSTIPLGHSTSTQSLPVHSPSRDIHSSESTGVFENGALLTPDNIQEKLAKLKKLEPRFTDLAKAYKILKTKQQQLESIVQSNTPITSLSKIDDFVDLVAYLKAALSNQNAGAEVTKLIQQLQQLKQAHDDESRTHADMYGSMQARLVDREEEINRLKHRLHKIEESNTSPEGASTPIHDAVDTPASTLSNGTPSSNPISMDSLTLKLKIRELSTSLKKTTEQRNKALEHIKLIESGNVNVPSLRLSIDERSGPSNTLDTLALTSPSDHTHVSTPTPQNSSALESTLQSRILELEDINHSWKVKSEQQTNSHLAIQNLVTTLREDNDRSIDRVNELEETQLTLENTIKELRAQQTELTDEVAGLVDDSEKLRSQVKELSKTGGSQKSTEHIRQENRERNAGLEARLRTVQQKLGKAEAECASLEEQLRQRDSEIKMLEQENHALPKADITKDVGLTNGEGLDNLHEKCRALQKDLESAVAEASITEENHKNDIIALQRELTTAQASQNRVNDEAHNRVSQLTGEMDHLNTEYTKLQSTVTELTATVSALKSEKLSLEEQLSMLQKESNIQAVDISEKSTTIASLESTVVSKEKELRSYTQETTGILAELRTQIKDLEEGMAQKTLAIEQLEMSISKESELFETSKRKCEDLSQELADRSHELSLQAEQLDQATSSSKSSARIAQNLEEELVDVTAQLSTALAKIEALHTTANAHQSALEAKIEKLEASIAPHATQLEQLQSQLEIANTALKNQVSSTEMELREKTCQIENLSTQADELKRQLQAGSGDVDATKLIELETQLREERSKATHVAAKNESLKDELAEKATTLTEMISEKQRIVHELQVSSASVVSLTSSLDILEQRLSESSKDSEDAQERYKKLQSTASKRLKQIEDLQNEISTHEISHTQLQKLVDGFKLKTKEALQRNKETQQQLDDTASELLVASRKADQSLKIQHELEIQLKDAQSRKTMLEEQLRVLHVDVETLNTAKLDVDSRIAAMDIQHATVIKSLSNEMDALKSNVEKLVAERDHLASELTDIKANLHSANDNEGQLAALQQECKDSHEKVKDLEEKLGAAAAASQERISELSGALDAANGNVLLLTTRTEDLQRALEEKEKVESLFTQQLAEANEQLLGLESKTVLSSTLETQLKEAQSSLAEKCDEIAAIEARFQQCQQSLKEESDKKNKSIQLLRNSKTRILKLESDLKGEADKIQAAHRSVDEAHAQRDQTLQAKEGEIINLVSQMSKLEDRIRQQQLQLAETQNVHKLREEDRANFEQNLASIKLAESSAREETVKAEERVRSVHAEMEAVRNSYFQLEQDLQAWTLQSQDYEARIETLDMELETSKSLFQTKSIENDQMKIRISELETNLFDSSQLAVRSKEELQQVQRNIKNVQKEAAEQTKELRVLEEELAHAKTRFSAAIEAGDERTMTLQKELNEYALTKTSLQEAVCRESEITEQIAQFEKKMDEFRKEIENLEAARKKLLAERDEDMTTWKMKETQYKNINKALKDEIRKLTRSSVAATASSGNSSPHQSYVDLDPSTLGVSGLPPLSSGRRSSSAVPAESSISASQPSLSIHKSSNPLINTSRSPLSTQTSSASLDQLSTQLISQPSPSQPSPLYQPRSSMQGRNSRDSMDLPDPNPEYLKHVILKFLESKDKRGQLLSVIGMLLKFTPEELKRAQRI
ncbi:hypothetical protein BASA61_005380 [Batrachochytrium salamandrivorans]|nr:hypothetical protein BASA60_005979 [Batrachochytrium salamandrivorans]KAH6574222.1 hypothetical protein BASA62_002541 [Batrachochytrium salamandrivorans]KAH6590087.1 hypothetical protein BASA61_005380 [Batrachochytrium salamandrivorans]KAH9270415.1 hypothetical protein BASA83_007414 [Batrachochytrium salamandrivorans]